MYCVCWEIMSCIVRSCINPSKHEMLAQYWPIVFDAGSILTQHWANDSCLLGCEICVHTVEALTSDQCHCTPGVMVDPDGSLGPVMALISEVQHPWVYIPTGSDICHPGCVYTVLQSPNCSNVWGVQCSL